MSETVSWPPLPLESWQDTYATVHLWTQMVGKTRLALAPPVNHWWHVTLYVNERGLVTSPMPYRDRMLDIEFDFIDHVLAFRTSDGATQSIILGPRSVADFHREYLATLRSLGLDVSIHPMPSEIPNAIPFDRDDVHRPYDPDAAQRCWRALLQSDRVLQKFRGRFLGKCSPVHFFWGGFDLACTRFSGRIAPPHPGGNPVLPDSVNREAYSHECISAGWWPGNDAYKAPAFYAYAYPEPKGLREAAVGPAGAYFDTTLGLFILPYEVVRLASQPDDTLMEFLQTTYARAADLLGWDRAALER